MRLDDLNIIRGMSKEIMKKGEREFDVKSEIHNKVGRQALVQG